MKLVIISDTHGSHRSLVLPNGDILIHAGDFSMIGRKDEVEDFFNWLAEQSKVFKHIVFIAGNHDKSFDKKFNPDPLEKEWNLTPGWLRKLIQTLPENVHYLENSEIELDGLKFYGSPITPWFYGDRWAFNKHRGKEIKECWNKISFDTDVLITHGPPAYKLDYVPRSDEYVGCEDLDYRIKEIKPILCCFGHIHEGYGIANDEYSTYVNASIMNERYNPVNKPYVVEIKR